MEQKEKKRQRSLNFSNREKAVLFNIISKHKNVVENKKTDAVSSNEKMAVWKIIATEFNSVSPNSCSRSLESLKKFYENKKKEVRKEVAENRKEVLLTGGGTLPKKDEDPNQDLILSIMHPTTVYGTVNPFDGDSRPFPSPRNNVDEGFTYDLNCQSTENCANVEKLEKDIEQSEDKENEENSSDTSNVNLNEMRSWKKYKPSDLMKTKCHNLKEKGESSKTAQPGTSNNRRTFQCSRRRPATAVKALASSALAEKYDKLVEKRLRIAEYEEKEHKLKIKLLELEIELKTVQLKALHKEMESKE